MKPMFGPKRFGFGISPRGWGGWGLTLALVVAGLSAPHFLSGNWMAGAEGALIGGYLLIAYLTYSSKA